jgi:hypothetical protein
VDVEKMAVEVETARTGTKRHSEDHASTEVLDIPDEVLDDCQKTFVAVQNISKASNKIFADTAIMALVCRHDCPLLLANMTSAGERQHYALALLRELFRQLPSDWHVRLLYDIACQLCRSMQKVCIVSLDVVNSLTSNDISLGISLNILTGSHLPSPCFMRMATNGLVSSPIILANALDLD